MNTATAVYMLLKVATTKRKSRKVLDLQHFSGLVGLILSQGKPIFAQING